MDIAAQFGLDQTLLLAQTLNFLLLLIVLRKFLYKPVTKMLKDRKDRIAKSLLDVQEIDRKLAHMEDEHKKIVLQAHEEAKQIIKEARKEAALIISQARQKADKESELIRSHAHEALLQEQVHLQEKIRSQMADLIGKGIEKVTHKALDERKQRELVDETVQNLV